MAAPAGAVEAYTDGACLGNPGGTGGWAWVTTDGRQASGSQASTTNQRMELAAALAAVTALPGPLLVVSDSAYVVNCFRDGWWRGWRQRGWVTSDKTPVRHRDLWEPLIDLVERRGDVAFRWVKGHSGNPLNEAADRLAVAAAVHHTDRPPALPARTRHEQVTADTMWLAHRALTGREDIPGPHRNPHLDHYADELERHYGDSFMQTVTALLVIATADEERRRWQSAAGRRNGVG